MKADRKRTLVVFGDITGSSRWSLRVGAAEFISFMAAFYGAVEPLRRYHGFFLKVAGDGFMAVLDLAPRGDRHRIIRGLRVATDAAERILDLIALAPVRPDGFRLRATVGACWKVVMESGERDYLGDILNTCGNTRKVARRRSFLATEALFEALDRCGCRHLTFRKCSLSARDRRTLDPDRIRHLWDFSFAKKRSARRAGVHRHRKQFL